jgi:uncharacterized phiE125 gp8 family phage protein
MNYLPFYQPTDYPLVTGTSTLVVTLDEAKTALRINLTDTSEDALITRLIYTATSYFELVTGRDLINKTYKCYLNTFPVFNSGYAPITYSGYNPALGITILKSKLQSVTSIKYYSGGVQLTWDPANYYITDNTDYAGIYLAPDSNWPSDIDNRLQSVMITFVAGYGATASDVPYDIKQALLQYICYLYENRGDCDCSGGYPHSAMTFFATRKILWLGGC